MPTRRRLFASIHDVSPAFDSEVSQLLDLVTRHVGDRIALLVVPDHWQRSPIVPGTAFATQLRSWANAGMEIFLHGFYHRDVVRHSRPADRVKANLMTAGEGEFLGLDRTEAAARLAAGQTLLEDITGRPIAGFIAPAWLYGRGAMEALTERGVAMAEDHMKVWSPKTGAVLSRSPVITWASRSRTRRASSIFAAGALRRLPFRDLRIGVHPGDCQSPMLLKSINETFRIASARRSAARYSDLGSEAPVEA